MTPQLRAEKSAAAMWSTDTASQSLGMRIDHIAPGAANLSMVVTAAMLNGHGIAHGGYIFTLADSAFAFACNSYNQLAVAQQNQISYLAPGKAGERLHAAAREISADTFSLAVITCSVACHAPSKATISRRK